MGEEERVERRRGEGREEEVRGGEEDMVTFWSGGRVEWG